MNRRAALVLAPGVLLAGCGFGRSAARFPPEVSGTVAYRERAALPPGAELRVTLYETRGANAAPAFIAEQTIPKPGRFPIRFVVAYPPSVIDARAGYALVARVEVDGSTILANERPVPVLTLGNPAVVEILVTRVPAGSR
jgi:putative lipoprotein